MRDLDLQASIEDTAEDDMETLTSVRAVSTHLVISCLRPDIEQIQVGLGVTAGWEEPRLLTQVLSDTWFKSSNAFHHFIDDESRGNIVKALRQKFEEGDRQDSMREVGFALAVACAKGDVDYAQSRFAELLSEGKSAVHEALSGFCVILANAWRLFDEQQRRELDEPVWQICKVTDNQQR